MNIPFFTKRPPERIHSVPRFHAATKRESAALKAQREKTTADLRRYVTEQKLVAAVRAALSEAETEEVLGRGNNG